jgi:hypothetical protein
MGWTIGVLGFDSRWGLGIFLFTTSSRAALGLTQHPIQWVAGALSLGLKRPEREADHSPPSNAEVNEWVELYLHSPNTPSWRGAQLQHRDNFTFTIRDFQIKLVFNIQSSEVEEGFTSESRSGSAGFEYWLESDHLQWQSVLVFLSSYRPMSLQHLKISQPVTSTSPHVHYS